MKKTHLLELLNNIKSTIVSFVSIILFVCLSVAIYTGVSWMTTNISLSIDRVIKDSNYRDSEIIFTYGFSDGDLKEIKEIDDNLETEAYKSTYEFFDRNNSKLQSLVYETPKSVDTLISLDGKLPIKDNEIGVDSYFAENYNYKIGDVIKFNENVSSLSKINTLLNYDINSDDLESINFDETQQYLKNREFTITCIFKTPRLLISSGGNYIYSPLNNQIVNAYMIVNSNAFNNNAYVGYTNILIRNHNYDVYSTYDDIYDDSMDGFSDVLSDKIKTIVNNKNQEIKNKINDIKIDANNKIEDGKNKIEDAKIKIRNNKQKLADAKIELDVGLITLQDAEYEYHRGENDLNSSKNELNELVSNYNLICEAENSFIGTKEQFVQYLNGIGVFDKITILAGSNIFDGSTTADARLSVMHNFMDNYISNARGLIHNSEKKLGEAEKEIEDGYNTYYDNLNKYNKGLNDIKKAENDLKDAELDLQEAIDLYNDFIDKTKDFEDGKYGTTYRKQNTGIIISDAMLTMFDKLRYSMAALFVVVGLLVCYSVISRIVNNQIVNIGTKKALGFNRKQITIYYLSYTGIATLVGCILGVLVGYFGIENIFISILDSTFSGKLVSYFEYGPAVSICLLEIVLLLIVTFIACNSVLKKNAITLLRQENVSYAKVRFYEKTKLWDKLSILTKTIINNFFNDKRRVFATLIGIAGSTALIVTAITFRSNFVNSYKYQFDEIFKFKFIIYYDADKGHEDDLMNYLYSNNIDNSFVYSTRGSIKCDDGSYIPNYYLVSLDLDSYKRMINIIPFVENNLDPYSGCWISGPYANFYNSKNGDVLTTYDINGNRHDIATTGFYKHYLMNNYFLLDKNTYDNIYGSDVKANCILVNTDNVDIETLKKDIYSIDNSASYDYFYESSRMTFNLFDQLSQAILYVYITLSIIMALLVLLNLLIMFINEKKYELIILMINGFSRSDAKRYIYSDIIVLTILGTIIGIFIGSYVGNISVASFETNVTLILKNFDPLAIILGTLGSFVITFVITLISLKKIDKFKLADINKP